MDILRVRITFLEIQNAASRFRFRGVTVDFFGLRIAKDSEKWFVFRWGFDPVRARSAAHPERAYVLLRRMRIELLAAGRFMRIDPSFTNHWFLILPVSYGQSGGAADELHGFPCLSLFEYEVVAHVVFRGFSRVGGAARLQLSAEEA